MEEEATMDGSHCRRSYSSASSDAAVTIPSNFHSYLCNRIGRARLRDLCLALRRRGQHHRDPGDGDNEGVVARAIPTIQFPAAFAGGPVGIPSDAEVTRNWPPS